jgi:hypothetical protein
VNILIPNKAKTALAEGLLNFGRIGTNQGSPHTFKLVLMDSSFSFNKVEHSFLSDVETHVLQEANGYTAKTLNPLTLAFDVNNTLNITFPTLSWTASGGSIGPFSGALIYDDNGTYSSQKILVVYFLYQSLVTVEDGNSFALYYGLFRI